MSTTPDELASADPELGLSLLQNHLGHRVRVRDASDSRASLITGAMQRLAGGVERVAALAKELAVSDRHLRRLFKEQLGMTPKVSARIARLNRVLDPRRHATPWAELALESGYSDQSHMIHEFRALLRTTPSVFFAREGKRGVGPPSDQRRADRSDGTLSAHEQEHSGAQESRLQLQHGSRPFHHCLGDGRRPAVAAVQAIAPAARAVSGFGLPVRGHPRLGRTPHRYLTTPKGQTVGETYQAWSVVVGDIGTFCFYLFIWYVFRRDSLGAKVALGAVAVVFVISIVRDTILNGVTFGPPPGSVTTLAAAAGRTAVFAWMASEAFTSYLAFRKRARIGLGNPQVANRLLLWGVSAVVMFSLSAVATSLYLTATDTVDATLKQNQAGGAYGVLAAVSSIALWLAFFPPRFYERWLVNSLKQELGNG